MGKRGPKPSGQKIIVLNKIEKQRPKAIPGMTRYARTIWKKTVDSHNPNHFKPGNLEQLRAYCEACSAHKQAILEIKKAGAVIKQGNGILKRNPWCLERDSCSAIISSLSTKLQLNVNSTTKKGSSPKPKSKRGDLIYGGDL